MTYSFGFKCAGCGEHFGDWIPDDGCKRCGCITAEKYREPVNYPPYVTITYGIRGWFCILVTWVDDAEIGGYYDVWADGFGSYATKEEAIPEAKSWAFAEGVEFKL